MKERKTGEGEKGRCTSGHHQNSTPTITETKPPNYRQPPSEPPKPTVTTPVTTNITPTTISLSFSPPSPEPLNRHSPPSQDQLHQPPPKSSRQKPINNPVNNNSATISPEDHHISTNTHQTPTTVDPNNRTTPPKPPATVDPNNRTTTSRRQPHNHQTKPIFNPRSP